MKTNKEISTIWFGSTNFLKMILDKLIDNKKIQFYAFVNHKAEGEEKKDHAHVYIVPNGQIDTDQLTELLTEMDLVKMEPIRPLPYKKSKFDDWYLYGTHNELYLLSKGNDKKKYTYTQNQFITSSPEYLNELVNTIDYSKNNRIQIVKTAAERGETFDSLIAKGQIPIPLIRSYKYAYDIFYQAYANAQRRQYREQLEQKEKDNEIETRNLTSTEQKLLDIFGVYAKKE